MSLNIKLIEGALLAPDVAILSKEEMGATVSFFGTVRRDSSRPVTKIYYEMHYFLTNQILHIIAKEAFQKWGKFLYIKILHSYGFVCVGHCSIFIVVSSKHRRKAFEVCEYILQAIKHRAPIWKKEYYSNSFPPRWLDGYSLNKE